jgi:hypothetical protein
MSPKTHRRLPWGDNFVTELQSETDLQEPSDTGLLCLGAETEAAEVEELVQGRTARYAETRSWKRNPGPCRCP